MKKPIISDKVVKYAVARTQGKSKKASKEIAGYAPSTLTTQIEKSDSYKQISIKSSLLKHISIDQLTQEHLKLIEQDDDKGIKLSGIKLAYERIEPEGIVDDTEEVIVTLK